MAISHKVSCTMAAKSVELPCSYKTDLLEPSHSGPCRSAQTPACAECWRCNSQKSIACKGSYQESFYKRNRSQKLNMLSRFVGPCDCLLTCLSHTKSCGAADQSAYVVTFADVMHYQVAPWQTHSWNGCTCFMAMCPLRCFILTRYLNICVMILSRPYRLTTFSHTARPCSYRGIADDPRRKINFEQIFLGCAKDHVRDIMQITVLLVDQLDRELRSPNEEDQCIYPSV